jgi:hypothetical protein
MLDESLDALLKPFHAAGFKSLSAKLAPHPQLLGFVMPGNAIGAGLHELCQSLLGAAAVVVKNSSEETFFFAAFARALREIDAQVGSRIAVLNWGRGDTEQTSALMKACDCIVAFGDDATLETLTTDTPLIGFGSRASGALVASGHERKRIADAFARDVSLFEQRGCLSPHHVFVEDRDGATTRDFARELAASLAELARRTLPPSRLNLPDAAAVRSARENARWARIGGRDVAMWEGEAASWTVIYDADAAFRLSPGYRVVYVSPVADLADFRRRVEPVSERLEAFAVADPKGRLQSVRVYLGEIGVSWIADPGGMQSPPLDWRHGGGALLDLFLAR